jgi:hypothetical protein
MVAARRVVEAVVTPMLGVPRLRPWTCRRTALLLFLTDATARTSGPVALVVGTVLTPVNRGTLLRAGPAGLQRCKQHRQVL